MKILVVDDTLANLVEACEVLHGHDVTTAFSFEEAQKILEPREQNLMGKHIGELPEPFEALLTDLMLPASDAKLSGEAKRQYAGKEMPLGIFLAFLALRVGIKKVAIVTDKSHHEHPAAAAFDVFRWWWEGPFVVGDAKVLCVNDSKSWKDALRLLNGEPAPLKQY